MLIRNSTLALVVGIPILAAATSCGDRGLPQTGSDAGDGSVPEAPLPDGPGPGADKTTSDPPPERTCSEINAEVAAWIAAHRGCAADTDCTGIATRCGLPGTCEGQPINKLGANGIGRLLEAWDELMCGATIACAPCPTTLPRPIVCSAGGCDHKEPKTCDELEAEVGAFIANDEHRRCFTNADCIATATNCGLPGVCGTYLNRSADPQLQAMVRAFQDGKCDHGRPCPGCIQPAPAACVMSANGAFCGPAP